MSDKSEKVSQAGNRIPWYLGFGLMWAVEYSLFSGSAVFSVTGFVRVPNDPFNIASLAGLVLISFGMVFLYSKETLCAKLHLDKVLPILSTFLILAGLASIALIPELPYETAMIVLACSGFASGSGFSLQTIAWGKLFTEASNEINARQVAVTFLFGMILCVALQCMPYGVAFILSVVFLVGSGMLLRYRQQKGSLTSPLMPPGKQTKQSFSLLGTILFFTCVLMALYTASSQIAFRSGGFEQSNLVFGIAMVAASLVVLILVYRRSDSLDSLPLYDVVFFVVGGALIALPFFAEQHSLAMGLLVVAGLRMVRSFLIIFTIEVARKLKAHAGVLFGIIEGCLHSASFLGIVLAVSLFRNDMGFMQLALFSVAGVYVLGSVLVVVMRRMRATEVLQPSGPTVESLAVTKLDEQQRAELTQLAEKMLEQRCQELATEGNLTKREGDVLVSLAQGNSIAKTADVLGVSLNTVKTHAKMVYVKLDVHNRQELSDVIREG